MAKPSSAWRSNTAWMLGPSVTQGSHQDAQYMTSATLPRSSSDE
jgi:hypothetical protein